MSVDILAKWERDFRTAALADNFAVFRNHLRRLGLPDSPDLMLEGTIRLVRVCSAYAALDGHSENFREFLAMQAYDPAEAIGARHAYTFDIFRMAFDRVFVGANGGVLDLADIYGSPWQEYEVVGFNCF